MTEAAPILFTAIDDPIEVRASTAGTVQPHVECKIVDAETGRLLQRGERGELCARGYCVMRGYWNDPASTAAVIDADGWVHTGDLAVMHDDGSVSIDGRTKELIIRGGENVSPREIEDLLHTHPAVLDVYVVGVPDREYGEEICACVKLRPGATLDAPGLRAFCRAHIAAHKIPRYVYAATDFPMTASGKLQRFRLREMAIANLEVSDVATARGH
jgi:fatty-acyl-CoA synthase